MRVYLGVSAWGLVAIDGMDGSIHQRIPFKTHSWLGLVQELHKFKPYIEKCVIERFVPSYQEKGIRSAFKQGRCVGIAQGILLGMGICCREVSPTWWHSMYGIPKGITPFKRKKLIHDTVVSLFPTEEVATDMEDTLLLAHYAFMKG